MHAGQPQRAVAERGICGFYAYFDVNWQGGHIAIFHTEIDLSLKQRV